MPVPIEEARPQTDVSHEATAYVTLLWRHIYERVRGMLHPHHREHEPGGRDMLELRLGELHNVYAATPGDGQALVYQASTTHWIPGAATGTSRHQAHFSVSLPTIVDPPPGPTNITGSDMTIKAIRFASDGACSGAVSPGGTFVFGAGGGVTLTTPLSITWSNLVTLALILVGGDVSDGTYLTVDIAVE